MYPNEPHHGVQTEQIHMCKADIECSSYYGSAARSAPSLLGLCDVPLRLLCRAVPGCCCAEALWKLALSSDCRLLWEGPLECKPLP